MHHLDVYFSRSFMPHIKIANEILMSVLTRETDVVVDCRKLAVVISALVLL